MVKVYTLPNCPQCTATKRYLLKNKLSFEEIALDKNGEARDHVASLGFKAAPVVEVSDGRSWSGFRPGELRSLLS